MNKMKLSLKQELWRLSLIAIQGYSVLNGALLVIFVPGVCNGRRCSPLDNFQQGSVLYKGVAIVNLVTLVSFIALYAVEIRREYRLNNYLYIDNTMPMDSATMSQHMSFLKTEKKEKLHMLTQMYKLIGTVTLCIFVINTICSGYVIFRDYGNDRGPETVATSTLLIGGKLYDIYKIIAADQNVYLSAYESHHVQFNCAKPSKCVDATHIPNTLALPDN